MYISEAHFGSFSDEATGKTALMQIFQNYQGLTEININSSFMGGKTLEEIDNAIANTKSNLAQNLQEATVHECGHAKTYYGKSIREIVEMNNDLSEMGVDGISKIAAQDGAECIAEVEVLLFRGQPVPQEAMDLYNRYVKKR